MDLSLEFIAMLLVLGLIAGVINTLAGGGSNLTIPALMIVGMPAEIANATNRVGVVLQALVGLKGFHANDRLEVFDVKGILWPTLVGGLIGAVAASYAPSDYVKPLLLFTMLGMALLILLRPSTVEPGPEEMPRQVSQTPSAVWSLLFAGFYGGFVQAGVGFLLLGALCGSLRYDLVRANALKILCTVVFTLVALIIFIARDQVLWLPGLVLAVGTMVGAHIGVKLAISVRTSTLKWFLFVMTLFAVLAAFFN